MPHNEYQKEHVDQIGVCAEVKTGTEAFGSLGIQIGDPAGLSCYWHDEKGWWKEVGRIVVWDHTGRIGLFPYADITDDDLAFLRGAVWEAWFDRPRARHATDWVRRSSKMHGPYFECYIALEIDASDPFVIRKAEGFRSSQDREFRTMYDSAAGAA